MRRILGGSLQTTCVCQLTLPLAALQNPYGGSNTPMLDKGRNHEVMGRSNFRRSK